MNKQQELADVEAFMSLIARGQLAGNVHPEALRRVAAMLEEVELPDGLDVTQVLQVLDKLARQHPHEAFTSDENRIYRHAIRAIADVFVAQHPDLEGTWSK